MIYQYARTKQQGLEISEILLLLQTNKSRIRKLFVYGKALNHQKEISQLQ